MALAYALGGAAWSTCRPTLRWGEVLLTAGGSSYFDRVAATFTPARRGPGTRVVLRGGSYLTYDHGFHRRKMGEFQHRGGIATVAGVLDPTVALQPALELWALVQALHDPGTATSTTSTAGGTGSASKTDPARTSEMRLGTSRCCVIAVLPTSRGSLPPRRLRVMDRDLL